MSLTFTPLLQKGYQDLLFQMLQFFEGIDQFAYNDSKKNPTIGIGFEISAQARAILTGMGYSAASFIDPTTFDKFVTALQKVGESSFPNSRKDGESAALISAINSVANKYLGKAYGEFNKQTGTTNPNDLAPEFRIP